MSPTRPARRGAVRTTRRTADARRPAEASSRRPGLALAAVGGLVLLLLAGAVALRLTGWPSWPGGAAAGGIVYTDGERLWVADPDRPNARREVLNARGKGTLSDPAWSPDRAQIAYSFLPAPAPGASFGADLYVVRADGGNPRAVFTHDVDGGVARAPAWAPDGKALYFSYSSSSVRPGQTAPEAAQRIERLDLATGRRTVIVGGHDQPAVAPDGAQIVAVRADPAAIGSANAVPSSLSLVGAAGESLRTLVAPGQFGTIWAPRFSPDGRFVAFGASGGDRSRPRFIIPPQPRGQTWPPSVAAHGLPMDLWLVEVATGRLELLAALGADDPTPVWSPDGRCLAYGSGAGIVVLDLTTGAATPLLAASPLGAIDWSR
jgi:Tol biopolymer transport system component